MPSLHFRPVTPDDAPVLAQLVAELNDFHNDKTRIDAESLMQDWDQFEAYVVEYHGEIAGF